jgi:glutamine synthetase
VRRVVKDAYAANKQVIFGGDNYSDEWHAEAERRGLFNLRSTPDALPWLINEQTVGVFSRYDVLSERELDSRYEVFVEQYSTKLNIEAETAASIARTMLLPAAVRQLNDLVAAGAGGDGATEGIGFLTGELRELIDEFVFAIQKLEAANADHPEDADALGHAKYMRDTVVPAMDGVREVADRLERIVADDLWPLPKYSEMLFIK